MILGAGVFLLYKSKSQSGGSSLLGKKGDSDSKSGTSAENLDLPEQNTEPPSCDEELLNKILLAGIPDSIKSVEIYFAS